MIYIFYILFYFKNIRTVNKSYKIIVALGVFLVSRYSTSGLISSGFKYARCYIGLNIDAVFSLFYLTFRIFLFVDFDMTPQF